ncbi:MAG: hypothetical protein M1821_000834 [Bathelium mastoideum]|nr:MAG: hypothetical protein M1821_000834 [Bathelium mastoideum]
MDSAREVDLARPEAPPSEILESSLAPHARSQDTRASSPSLRGAYATSSQISLKPKRSHSPKPSVNNNEQASEVGTLDGTGLAFTLQQADEGFGAWSYAASAFAMFIVVWGFPQAFPIFQTYLATGENTAFQDSTVLALLAPGLQDIIEGLLFPIFPKAPKYRKAFVIAGILIMMLAMFLASCAEHAWQVFLTQGILYGVGGIMLNFVHVSIFSEWFEKKRGTAMGFIWVGWRVGGLGFPLVCRWLLDMHGYTQTMRVLMVPMLVLLLPAVLLFRGRFPNATVSSSTPQPSVSKFAALRTPGVLFHLFVSLCFYLVTNVPIMFIINYAVDLALNPEDQAIALTLRVLSDMIGTYLFGWLGDHGYYLAMLTGSSLSSSLIYALVWGFAKSKSSLFTYAIVIGLANGGL